MQGPHYRVEPADLLAHDFALTLTLDAPAQDQIVSLPAWIPGSYLLREFAKQLSGLQAEQHGKAVPIEQLDKAHWRVSSQADGPLMLRWRVHAFDNSVRTAWLDAQRGFFNGTSLLLRVHGQEGLPHTLELAGFPAQWQIATSMRETGRGCYAAADYDELVDHPFELGEFWSGEFAAGGVPHRIVVSGAWPSFDGARLLADVQRICETQIAFWGEVPFPHYCFLLNVVDEGGGGLEHRASTALLAARRELPRVGSAEQSDGYINLLSLFSHEYFHAWNVKRLRPAELARYDYERENYTQLLWFFEGFTSYYDELMLRRAGLIEAPRYLKLLAKTVSGVLATPGRRLHSLAEASFEAWTKFYRPDEHTPNLTVSYYGKGALVALALDLRLRAAGASLDALMRRLWQGSGGGPVSEGDILAAVGALGGNPDELARWVHGTEDPPLRELLAEAGVLWRQEAPNMAQRLGLRVSESALTGVQIKQVMAGSAAQAAGLCPGDEVLGCNGWRLRRLEDILASLPSAQELLRFTLSRDQRLMELCMPLPAAEAALADVHLALAEAKPAAGTPWH
jgi:predicted metalloprotease with PDZ domain